MTIFGKSWLLHVTEVLGATPAENLDMIAESVGFVADRGREAIYDAEHYFDGYKADPRTRSRRSAPLGRRARARSSCATRTAAPSPTSSCESSRETRAALEGDPPSRGHVGHPHAQRRRARGRQLAGGGQAGARHVQATINGYGERCGNANMVSVLANLALKTDFALTPAGGGRADRPVALSVAEIANVAPAEYQPFVGRSAFAHKGGVHGAAVAKVERSYQHVDPTLVGNESRLVVSELGGRANTRLRAEQLGHRLEGVDPRVLSQTIKELENQGLAFEGAEASFELLIRRSRARLRGALPRSSTTPRSPSSAPAASCSPRRPSRSRSPARSCTPPPTATAPSTRSTPRCARRSPLFYPELESVHLVDYKVRILDGEAATAARTRVIIDSIDGERDLVHDGLRHEHHRRLGAALADSLEYAIWKTGAELRRRDERQLPRSALGPARATRALARRRRRPPTEVRA